MAIEDAVVLAGCLVKHPDPSTAFRVYECLRHKRTARVTNISRFYGAMGQWKHPLAAWFRTALFRFGSGKAATKNYLKFINWESA